MADGNKPATLAAGVLLAASALYCACRPTPKPPGRPKFESRLVGSMECAEPLAPSCLAAACPSCR